MTLKRTILLLGLVSSCAGLEAEPATPAGSEAYSNAVSPIIGYGPVYGAVLGAAWFRYPAPGAELKRPVYRDLFIQGTVGGQFSLQIRRRQPDLWPEWEHSLALSVDNFFDYEFPDGASEYQRFDRWRLMLDNEMSRTISGPLSALGRLSVAGRLHERDGDDVNTYPGLGLRWDSRDTGINPRRGTYAVIAADVQPDALHSKRLDQTGWRGGLDVRRYFPMPGTTVMALRFEGNATDGEVFDTALGGDSQLRGYVARRFVGESSMAAQAEVRFPLVGWVSGVAFAETGWIQDGDYLETPSSTGGGLRFGLPPDGEMKVRADLGMSAEGDVQFFVSFNQVF
ncbi:MAG: BamA/TamA family outer membrane protein [Saccharospirillum sp.]|uniref:BamA/TamA family outer membrane protein n=1 Tax=Saccharospirillum sp. TaxID=2033801 RepID=UPI0032971A65